MSDALTFKLNKFEFGSSKDEVHVNIDVKSVPPGGGDINYLYIAVGAEAPIKVANGLGTVSGNFDGTVPIGTTLKTIEGFRGNKPISLTAYACWVYDEGQAAAWIKANAAITAPVKNIYA